MATENLQIPDIAASQNQKEVTANAAHNLLDRAANKNVQKTITGSALFTTTETRENFLIELTGTPGAAFTLDMPDTNKRTLAVLNNTGQTATIRNSAAGGADQPVLVNGAQSYFHYDGVDFTPLGSGAVDFLTLNDTPGSYAGQAGKVATVNSGETALEFTASAGGAGGGLTNIIINGNFDIWQRGTVFSATSPNTYTADRFLWDDVGSGTVTVLRSTDTPDTFSKFSLRVDLVVADTVIAANAFYTLEQRIEGFNIQQFGFGAAGAADLTLSFRVKSAKTGIHCVAFRNSAENRSFVAEYTVDVADTWEAKTITLTADVTGTWLTESDIGLTVSWALAAGTDFQTAAGSWTAGNFLASSNQVNVMDNAANNFHLSRVQLEIDGTATAFERRSIALESDFAARYYEQLGGDTTNEEFAVLQARTTGIANGAIRFRRKRAAPTVTFSGASLFSLTNAAAVKEATSAVTAASPSKTGFTVEATKVTADLVAGEATRFMTNSTSARIKIDAEL